MARCVGWPWPAPCPAPASSRACLRWWPRRPRWAASSAAPYRLWPSCWRARRVGGWLAGWPAALGGWPEQGCQEGGQKSWDSEWHSLSRCPVSRPFMVPNDHRSLLIPSHDHLPTHPPASPHPLPLPLTPAGFNQALGIIAAIAISHYVAHLCGTAGVYHDDLEANKKVLFLHEVCVVAGVGVYMRECVGGGGRHGFWWAAVTVVVSVVVVGWHGRQHLCRVASLEDWRQHRLVVRCCVSSRAWACGA